MADAPQSLFDQEDQLKVLYYGAQGTWKTTHMARLAHLGRVIYINAEAGLKRLPLRKLGVPLDRITPVKCLDYDEYDALYWQVKANLEDHEPGDPARIVGVNMDSFTEIQKALVGNVVGKRVDKATRAGKTGEAIDPFFTDRDDYGKMTEQCRLLTRRFRDLPCHVGFSALEKRMVEGDGVKMMPALTPAFTTDLMGYVDMVCYTNVVSHEDGRTEGLGVFRPVGKYAGKDRYGVTPIVMADPSMDRLVGLINETLELDSDPAQIAYATRKAAELAAAVEPEPTDEPETEPEAAAS